MATRYAVRSRALQAPTPSSKSMLRIPPSPEFRRIIRSQGFQCSTRMAFWRDTATKSTTSRALPKISKSYPFQTFDPEPIWMSYSAAMVCSLTAQDKKQRLQLSGRRLTGVEVRTSHRGLQNRETLRLRSGRAMAHPIYLIVQGGDPGHPPANHSRSSTRPSPSRTVDQQLCGQIRG